MLGIDAYTLGLGIIIFTPSIIMLIIMWRENNWP